MHNIRDIHFYNTVIFLIFAETGDDDVQSEEEGTNEPLMSLKEVLQSLKRTKDCLLYTSRCV